MIDNQASNLLVEIGTEELPPKALRRLAECFAQALVDALSTSDLTVGVPVYRWFATPRRLAVWIRDVRVNQPDRIMQRRGPAVQAAFNAAGDPTQAALGFARSCGVEVHELGRASTDKGEWLAFSKQQKGESAKSLIPDCIAQSIKQLPIPKRMRWGELDSEFVRPVHWMVVLHGRESVPTTLLSVQSGNCTRGHRFHSPRPLQLPNADSYQPVLLEQGSVIADFDDRKQQIKHQVETLAQQKGGVACVEDALLEQVTGLVEWPHSLLGEFDRSFLDMPPEVLVSSMRDHQKYFHATDAERQLLPWFITVSNIKSISPARIREGNERVLRARLADAQFFWDVDRKTTLERHGARLADVLFHKQLGSVEDKVFRLQRLAGVFAPWCGVDAEQAMRAAQLAKADLVTDMVGEFPDLQGVMGRYYAQHDGEHTDVADACADHYKPRFGGDDLPRSGVSKVVALVDRIDSLVGIFAAGEEPSGDKDPYALRRAALGVLRVLIEGGLDVDLQHLLREAALAYNQTQAATVEPDAAITDRVYEFIMDRLHAYYIDQGFSSDEIASVMAGGPSRPLDFDRRLRAVSKFRRLEAAANLAAANKRIGNILKKAGGGMDMEFDLERAIDPAEKALAEKLYALEKSVLACFEDARYETGLRQLASLKEPVDRFFDEVMVMAEDAALRANRLALLRKLKNLFLQVADISYLQDPGAKK